MRRRPAAGRTGDAGERVGYGGGTAAPELAAARACGIKHFFSIMRKRAGNYLASNLQLNLVVTPSDPNARIAVLERELAWAHLKIQALTEELRQQRVKLRQRLSVPVMEKLHEYLLGI